MPRCVATGFFVHISPVGGGFCRVRGTVTRWVETSPKQHHQVILKNILHIEGIKRRFLSTIQFQDNDYIISLEQTCAVFHRNGKRLFSAPRHDRAIELILYSEQPLKSYSLNVISELPIKLWHERMGHLNWDALKKTQLTTSPPIVGIQFDESEPPHSKCEGCIAGKSKRRAYKSSASSSKSQTFHVFKKFKALAENLTGHKMKFFHSDRGGEFMSHEFTEFLEQEGITHETSAPQTPQQNGTVECMNQTILGGACAMLHHAGMTLGFWSEAVHVAAHILNHSPRSGLDWKTPFELLFGRKPEVTHIRMFGCRAWAIDDKAKKWDPRSTPMVFVGYEIASKAYCHERR